MVYDILLTIVITMVLTAMAVRYMDRAFERIAVLHAYLLGVSDAIERGRLDHDADSVIERVKDRIRKEIKK